MHLSTWPSLSTHRTYLAAVECHPFDKSQVLTRFQGWGQELNLAVYFTNPGFAGWQQVGDRGSCHAIALMPVEADPVQWLLDHPTPGVFILEGLDLTEQRQHQLANAFEQARWNGVECHWVLLSEQMELPPSMQGMIPVLSLPLPDGVRVDRLVQNFCTEQGWQGDDSRLARAARGLSEGEIEWVLRRERAIVQTSDELAARVLEYKTRKLAGRGLEFIGQPDVPRAGGVDLLGQRLDKVMSLLDPKAEGHGLIFPKGMLLWGPPGTGKSLSAKLAASKMGVPLLAADWNGLRGDDTTQSLRNLRWLLDTAESMAPCVLYFDDFDKAFNLDDAVGRQSAQRLLTWMQEHTQPVFVMATVNRVGMLPVELQRRFDDIFFFDLPHDGARYDIFNLHLAKYFPAFKTALETGRSPWSDDEWREVLTQYRLCIPSEIGNAVRRVAEEAFYQNYLDGRTDQPLSVQADQLLVQREQFTPLMVREEGPMLMIRNNATYAQPVCSPDSSRFALKRWELFGDGED